MVRRIDYDEANRKARGRKDHALSADREREREFAKRAVRKEAGKWAAKMKAGKPPKTKAAKRSGPVRHLSPEEIAIVEAELRARGDL